MLKISERDLAYRETLWDCLDHMNEQAEGGWRLVRHELRQRYDDLSGPYMAFLWERV